MHAGDPNPDEPHEMGDPNKKEMTDQEMENFDEKRSEAMQAFSEVSAITHPPPSKKRRDEISMI